MVNFLTRGRFLEILQEEIDKMVEAEGLILRSEFPRVMEVRLQKEITKALARNTGLVDITPL
jgi:hypothetical protein